MFQWVNWGDIVLGELVVLTKVPERGYVKTRLQKRLSAYVVEQLYTGFLKDTLDRFSDYDPYVAYYPETKLQMLWTILGDRRYVVQRGKDLWERLLTIFDDFYRAGIDDVCAINCDVPLLKKETVDEAFKLMSEKDLVLGPAYDGGFYLIGGKGLCWELFDGVKWKNPNALDGIKANADRLGLKVAVLESYRDVDTPEDLKTVWESGELEKKSKTYEIVKKVQRQL